VVRRCWTLVAAASFRIRMWWDGFRSDSDAFLLRGPWSLVDGLPDGGGFLDPEVRPPCGAPAGTTRTAASIPTVRGVSDPQAVFRLGTSRREQRISLAHELRRARLLLAHDHLITHLFDCTPIRSRRLSDAAVIVALLAMSSLRVRLLIDGQEAKIG